MRQLLYHWVFEPTSFATTASTTFAGQNWPLPKEPFSLFTSSFGSAGKVPYQGLDQGNGLADNLYPSGQAPARLSPTGIASRSLIHRSSNPTVRGRQQLGSTPGVLPARGQGTQRPLGRSDRFLLGNALASATGLHGFPLPTAVYDLLRGNPESRFPD